MALYSVDASFFTMLPKSSFALSYVFLSQQLRSAIKVHSTFLPARSFAEFEGILRSYINLKEKNRLYRQSALIIAVLRCSD